MNSPFRFLSCALSATGVACAIAPALSFADPVQIKLRELLKVPENQTEKITLDFKKVALAAVEHSDSFKTIVAKAVSIRSADLNASSITDAYLTLGGKQEWNRNQPVNPFGTSRFDQSTVDINYQQYLQTGTRFTLGLSEYRNNSTFGGGFGSIDAKAAGARIQLEQSLWRDFFGQSTRLQISSGVALSKAKKIEIKTEIEDWFISLSDIYHQAWQAQRQIAAVEKTLKRREQLSALYQRRQALGISEEADRLQIETAVEQNRIQLNELKLSLDRIWNLLIVTLKLPSDFKSIDPLNVPLVLDATKSTEVEACLAEESRQIKGPPQSGPYPKKQKFAESLIGF